VPVHIFGVFDVLAAPVMFGQWCVPEGAVCRFGAVCRLGAVLLEGVVAVVDALEDAALAIAAPPPTRAPLTTSVVTRDFSMRIRCSPPFSSWA
jgi:hypothetical protein